MSEQEIREGMLLAVWDEPPLDFDPDTLIRRVEQKKSRRRALVAVGVATAMIAVASLTLPGLLPRDRDTQLGS
ncbi:MAG TPA: twin-arginine translocation signal domain-containing protein, partial [Lentzea sp.]